MSVDEVIKVSYSWAKQYAFVSKADVTKRNTTIPHSILVSNCVQLNTDGAVQADSGFAAARGLCVTPDIKVLH